jgi:hypothetical protein
MALIRVDLPAPFWPMSAITSPASTSSDAPISAGIPANFLSTALAERSGMRGDLRSCERPPVGGRSYPGPV